MGNLTCNLSACSRVPAVFLNTWENYFRHILNVYEGCDVKQMEIHAAEPCTFEVGIAVTKLRRDKSNSKQVKANHDIPRTKNFLILFEKGITP
jgi:hypothetical protein